MLGGIYAWSLFVPYLMQDYGLTSGECGFIFGLTILMFTFTMILSGWVMTHKGPRVTVGIGALLFMGGYVLASLSGGSFIMLLLAVGVVAGAGIGFGYVCPLSVSMKWFPNRKGLVTGVAVAGFGGGAILLSSIAELLLQGGMDVLLFFRWFGLCSGLTLLCAASLLAEPPGAEHEPQGSGLVALVLSPPFALICTGMFAGTFAGLLIIGNLTPMAMQAGLTEGEATVAVSVFAAGNALGRIVWGDVFDRIGYSTIALSLVSFAVFAGLLLFALPVWLHILAAGLLGFGFGSNFVVYASVLARYFGTFVFPRLYPICFLAYGTAGILGPGIGGYLRDVTGGYAPSLIICIALVASAGILSLVKLNTFAVAVEI